MIYLWFVFLGIYLALSFYHLRIFYGRREDISNLYFSLLAFSSFYWLLSKVLYNFFFNKSTIAFININTSIFLVILSINLFSYETLKLYKMKKYAIWGFLILVFLPYLTLLVIVITLKNLNLSSIIMISGSVPFGVIYWFLLTLNFFNKEEKKYKNKWQINIFIGITLYYIFYLTFPILFLLKFSNNLQLLLSNCGFLIMTFMSANALAINFNQDHRNLKVTNKKLEILTNTLEAKVIDRTKELKETIEQRTNFFINFAHETRTPLSLISNYLYKLEDQVDKINNKEIKNSVDIVLNNYEKIQKDIVNYLDIEKLESGKMLYNNIYVIELKSILEPKIQLFKKYAESKNIKLLSLIDDARVKIDPFAFDRIINNLLDNAVKYNKKGGEIRVGLKTENNKATLKVQDTGLGIDKEHLENIFKPFYQISHEKSNIQGMGMGLSIVKQIIDQFGGEINVESEKGKGTCFTIIFNLSDEKSNAGQIEIKNDYRNKEIKLLPDKDFDENKPVIFIIEDNIELLSHLQKEFYDIFNVYVSVNGKDALDKITKIPKPDIIISDIMMDEMDGYTFCKNIKDMDEYKNIPFIFLTAKTMEKDKVSGYIKGAFDYIVKPFNLKELYFKIDLIIEQNKINKSRILNEISEDKKSKTDRLLSDYRITVQELNIINLIKQGKENKEIAIELHVTEGTVKNHLKKIFLKTRVKTRTELIKLFL